MYYTNALRIAVVLHKCHWDLRCTTQISLGSLLYHKQFIRTISCGTPKIRNLILEFSIGCFYFFFCRREKLKPSSCAASLPAEHMAFRQRVVRPRAGSAGIQHRRTQRQCFCDVSCFAEQIPVLFQSVDNTVVRDFAASFFPILNALIIVSTR